LVLKYETPETDMACPDAKYLRLIDSCLKYGEQVQTRNSKVSRIIGRTVEFADTPLIGVRKTAWKNALREWEWFMSGSTRLDDLHPSVRHWWAPWKNESGVVLYNYSMQFRCFTDGYECASLDQVKYMVDTLKNHPYSRRNLLTTWHAAQMASSDCPITNCHNTVTQAFVVGGNRLRLVTYQRSVDLVCGLPHNWIQMAAFQLWLCAQTNLLVDGLTWIGGDIHLYEDHYPMAQRMLGCTDDLRRSPVLCYRPTGDDFKADDFYLDGEYQPLITDKVEMVV
jgi:thymidylate synthase